jgi:hypothetical protein
MDQLNTNIRPGQYQPGGIQDWSKVLADLAKHHKITSQTAGGTQEIVTSEDNIQSTSEGGYARTEGGAPTNVKGQALDIDRPVVVKANYDVWSNPQVQRTFTKLLDVINPHRPPETIEEDESVSFYPKPQKPGTGGPQVGAGAPKAAGAAGSTTIAEPLSNADLALIETMRGQDEDAIFEALKNMTSSLKLSNKEKAQLKDFAKVIALNNKLQTGDQIQAEEEKEILKYFRDCDPTLPPRVSKELAKQLADVNTRFATLTQSLPQILSMTKEQFLLIKSFESGTEDDIFEQLKGATKKTSFTDAEKKLLRKMAKHIHDHTHAGELKNINKEDLKKLLKSLGEDDDPSDLAGAIADELGDANANFLADAMSLEVHPELTEEQQQIIAGLDSTDKEVVLEALKALSKGSTYDIKALESAAEKIAKLNKSGGMTGLNSCDATQIASTLLGVVSLPEPVVNTIGANLAIINTQQIRALSAPPAEITLSKDQIQLLTAFSSIDTSEFTKSSFVDLVISLVGPLSTSDRAAIEAFFDSMLVANGKGGILDIESQDIATIKNILLERAPGLSSATLEKLAEVIVKANAQVTEDLNSIDSDVVLAALNIIEKHNLLSSDVPKETWPLVMDGLKAMAVALALMSRIKAAMTAEEMKHTGKISEAKVQISREILQGAMKQYESAVKTLEENYKSILAQEEAEKKAALWKWLGPVLTAVLAVVAVIVTIATCNPSALMAAMIIMQVLMAGVQIADQCTQCLDKLAESWGIKGLGAVEAFKMAIFITMALISGGIASCGGSLLSCGTTALVMNVVSITMQSLFSSGLITAMLLAIVRTRTDDEELQQKWVMGLTIALMAIFIIAMITASIMVGAKQAARTATDQAGTTAQQSTEIVIKEATEGTKKLCEPIELMKKILESMKKAAAALQEGLTKGATYLHEAFQQQAKLLELVNAFIKVGTSAVQMWSSLETYESNKRMQDIFNTQSELTEVLGELLSMMESSEATQGIFSDEVVRGLKATAEDLLSSMVSTLEAMITSLSQQTQKLAKP